MAGNEEARVGDSRHATPTSVTSQYGAAEEALFDSLFYEGLPGLAGVVIAVKFCGGKQGFIALLNS